MRIVLTAPALAAVALTLLAAGCGGSASSGNRRTVMAAFYPLAFVASTVAGASADVRNLTPPGAEPHDVELTPRDVAELQQADVVLYLSHGFQPAVEQAVKGGSGTRVDVLDGLTLKEGVGEERGKADPHVWLDPVLFARVVRKIGAALGESRHAARLSHRILGLDAEYRRGLAHCARRDIVTSHAAFGYLADRYGLRQVPITGLDPGSEPSAQRLRDLARLVRRDHVTTVFFEALVSPRLAETLAREAGAKTVELDPIEGLTPAEQRAGDDYISIMRRNLRALRAALGCR